MELASETRTQIGDAIGLHRGERVGLRRQKEERSFHYSSFNRSRQTEQAEKLGGTWGRKQVSSSVQLEEGRLRKVSHVWKEERS